MITMIRFTTDHTNQYGKLLSQMVKQLDEQHGLVLNEEIPQSVLLKGRYYLFMFDSKPIGYICLKKQSSSCMDINGLFILKKYRGKGYGKQCLQVALDYIKNNLRAKYTILGVYASNTTARSLYNSLGFETIAYTIACKHLTRRADSNFRFISYTEFSKNSHIISQLKNLYKSVPDKNQLYSSIFNEKQYNISVYLDDKVVAGSISFVQKGDSGEKFLYPACYPIAINSTYMKSYIEQVLSCSRFSSYKNRWMCVASEYYGIVSKYGRLQSLLMVKEL